MSEEKQASSEVKIKKKIKRKELLLTMTTIFIMLGLIFFIYWLFVSRFYETTDDAYVSGNLIEVMPQVSGHVTKILADETDLVTKGQPLVILDNSDAQIALRNTESQLALTVRQVSQLYQSTASLQATVRIQQENLKKAQEDYQRRLGLVVNKTISAEDMRHSKIAVNTADASLATAKHQFNSQIALIGSTDLYHHPQIQNAAANVRNAYLALQRTTIYAPETGYIAKRPVEVGQQIGPNSILMIIVPLNQVWVDANFKESQLENMRIGQPVTLISDAYGNSVKYKGKVVGLGPGTGSSFDLLPPQNATGNWIKIVQRLPVRISIDAKQLEDFPLRLGLSMTVSVNTHHRDGAVLTKKAQNRVIYETLGYSEDLKEADQMIDKILNDNAKNITYQAPQ
ncbi:MAG: efflux RND transporter periplasmic adaptor subunit [Gammaproteobacteria bacterium]|nr:efflux RND transporter periplasmic adaptor subunit [Gammaproteobacteria bacterium]